MLGSCLSAKVGIESAVDVKTSSCSGDILGFTCVMVWEAPPPGRILSHASDGSGAFVRTAPLHRSHVFWRRAKHVREGASRASQA